MSPWGGDGGEESAIAWISGEIHTEEVSVAQMLVGQRRLETLLGKQQKNKRSNCFELRGRHVTGKELGPRPSGGYRETRR